MFNFFNTPNHHHQHPLSPPSRHHDNSSEDEPPGHHHHHQHQLVDDLVLGVGEVVVDFNEKLMAACGVLNQQQQQQQDSTSNEHQNSNSKANIATNKSGRPTKSRIRNSGSVNGNLDVVAGGAHPILKFNNLFGAAGRKPKRKKKKEILETESGETRTLVDLDGSMNNKHYPAIVTTSPDHREKFDIITLNVSGLRFQTLQQTLERFPRTLLGNRARRHQYFNEAAGEYFFDRHRASFESILYFYQSNGRIKRPENVPLDKKGALKEMKFFEMNEDIMDRFWASEGYVKPEELPMPDNRICRIIWQLMEHPDTGWAARIVAFVSVFVIIVSIVSFCLETIPDFKEGWKDNSTYVHNCTNNQSDYRNEKYCKNQTSGSVNISLSDSTEPPTLEWENPFFCVEFVCIMWFTFEFILRLISCPSKVVFLKSFLNIIDIMAIAPFYVNLIWSDSSGGSSMSFAVLRVLRLVRVFRIFKLSRHSVGLQILGKTFAASVQELCLLFFFMLIALVLFSSAVYFAESGVEGSHFESIPHTFWYVIVTMTTVGYGDLVPKGPAGKLVGTSCAILGVLVLALPVPVIVGNFKHFYRQETKLAHIAAMDDDEDLPEDNASSAS